MPRAALPLRYVAALLGGALAVGLPVKARGETALALLPTFAMNDDWVMRVAPKPLRVGPTTLKTWMDIPMVPLVGNPWATLQGSTVGLTLDMPVGELTRTGAAPTLTFSGQAPVGLESWGMEGRLTLPLN